MRLQKSSYPVLAVWVLIHLILFAVLINHPDAAARANTLPLLILIAAGVIGAALILRLDRLHPPALLLRARTHRLFFGGVVIVSMLAMLVVWLVSSPALTYFQEELVRGYITGLILLGVYSTLFWCGADITVPWSAWLALGTVVLSVTFIITVHFVDRYPKLNTIDELHNWSVQWTFANTGLLGEAMFRQMIPIPQPIYDSPHYILGFLLRYIGDTFWQARFARLLLACLMLPFIYLCGKRMYGRRAALLAVVFAAIIMAPTAYVRPDVFVGVMLAVGLYVYLRAQTTRRPWMHYLTGLCIALAGEGHPLAYRFGLTFALIYMVRWGYEVWKTRRLFFDGRVFALALGGFTGVLIYLSIHIIPGFEQGIHFATNNSVLSRTSAQQLIEAQDNAIRQIQVWITTSPLEFLLLLAGIILAVYEGTQPDILLLTLLLVSELLMAATYGYYREFYQVHFLPVFALLIGRFLARLTETRVNRTATARLSNFVLVAMICILSLGIFGQQALASLNDPWRAEFTAIGKRLKADLPPDAIVVGNEDYFLEMRSLNYYGIQTVTTDHWFLVNYAGYKLWQVTNPDIFILTSELDEAKYTDDYSIYRYMGDNNFTLARCYTATGLIEARVYVRKMPPGWVQDTECKPDPAADDLMFPKPWNK